MQSEELLVFDNLSGLIYLVLLVDPSADQAYQNAQLRLDVLEKQLQGNAVQHSIARTSGWPGLCSRLFENRCHLLVSHLTVDKHQHAGDCLVIDRSPREVA